MASDMSIRCDCGGEVGGICFEFRIFNSLQCAVAVIALPKSIRNRLYLGHISYLRYGHSIRRLKTRLQGTK